MDVLFAERQAFHSPPDVDPGRGDGEDDALLSQREEFHRWGRPSAPKRRHPVVCGMFWCVCSLFALLLLALYCRSAAAAQPFNSAGSLKGRAYADNTLNRSGAELAKKTTPEPFVQTTANPVARQLLHNHRAMHAYTLVHENWCFGSQDKVVHVGDWATTDVRCDGSSTTCEKRCAQSHLCVGYITQRQTQCLLVFNVDLPPIGDHRKAVSHGRNRKYCWRKTLVGTSRSVDPLHYCTVHTHAWSDTEGFVMLKFRVVGDDSRGPVPRSASSLLSWAGATAALPALVEYNHEEGAFVAGIMTFRGLPPGVSFNFTFGREGFSTAVFDRSPQTPSSSTILR